MYIEFFIRPKYIVQFFLFFSKTMTIASTNSKQSKELEMYFNGGCGQLEVGGKFALVEFHKISPLSSKISFYYPVTNSIYLSTDYLELNKFLPLNFLLNSDNQIEFSDKIAYFSILMYEVLHHYVFIIQSLNLEKHDLSGFVELSEKIKNKLVVQFWDEKTGYLHNIIDEKIISYRSKF